jgi:hypothetical protein
VLKRWQPEEPQLLPPPRASSALPDQQALIAAELGCPAIFVWLVATQEINVITLGSPVLFEHAEHQELADTKTAEIPMI